MTEVAELTDTFEATIRQFDVTTGESLLTMQLHFLSAGARDWTVNGSAQLLPQLGGNSGELSFPVTGEFTTNPNSKAMPPEYLLQLNSDYPDHEVGISLAVQLTTSGFWPTSPEVGRQVWVTVLTGDYTWLQDEPRTVSDAKFEMPRNIV